LNGEIYEFRINNKPFELRTNIQKSSTNPILNTNMRNNFATVD